MLAAVSLAAFHGLICAWDFTSYHPGTLTVEGSRYSLRVGLLAVRCVLAAVVAGLLASSVSLSRRQLRVLESILFLGMTLLLMASQYFVGLDLMRRGSEFAPVILVFVKDGVILMIALMMIYGTLIPNRPATAAWTIAAMFVGPIAAEARELLLRDLVRDPLDRLLVRFERVEVVANALDLRTLHHGEAEAEEDVF